MSHVTLRATLALFGAVLIVLITGTARAEDPPEKEAAQETDVATRPDHDGDGIPNGQDADWTGNNISAGPGFVDADGNGECDRLEDGEPCPRANGRGWKNRSGRSGWGRRWKNGRGQGMRWVDRDGDGVCDRGNDIRDCGRGKGLPPCGRQGTPGR